MKQQDIVPLLTSFGFQGLSLINVDGNTSTMKFTNYNHSDLVRTLGEPTLAANGKVAVFSVPKVARIGVSPANMVLRFIAEVDSGAYTSQHHLTEIKIPKAYSVAYLKASVSRQLRIPFLKKLWDYLNTAKFGGRMSQPTLNTRPNLGGSVRAHYIGKGDCSPGTIEVADFLFNAREPFFLEIMLHEMCHQAARELSHSFDMSENGHGRVWQQWMVDVGLDPRRFDPTDPAEYQTTKQYNAKEATLNELYGQRALESDLKGLKKVPATTPGKIIMLFNGRLLEGFIEGSVFVGDNILDNKAVTLKYKTPAALKLNQFFRKV